ncbi:MAG: hypothetical protein KJO07_03930 [Deltaproteobacteria bacterium]|nr:hypothetical protein [Deltaproteobacteria bacterium]
MVRAGLGLVLVAAMSIVASGCLGPEIADGAVSCAGNGLCPDGFECAVDGRCYRYAGICGDMVLDPGETCDPADLCPSECNDRNACTTDNEVGSALTCNFRCVRTEITECADGDGCCPLGCSPEGDDDCLDTCGNTTLDPGETCDEDAGVSCDISCSDGDACTTDLETGSPANCNVACAYIDIDTCIDDDGCCPVTCNSATDNDCSPLCGNGEIDPGETCDPPQIPCVQPGECVPSGACSVSTYEGSESNCNARCVVNPITSCSTVSDNCCPDPGCVDDPDCVPAITCGDGNFDPATETCDDSVPANPCPTDCGEMQACKMVELVGSAATCDAECVTTEVTECLPNDDCCPQNCQGKIPGEPYYDPDCA